MNTGRTRFKKGHKVPWRKKISKTLMGHSVSKEIRKKLSKARQSKKTGYAFFKGKKLPIETRKKMSKAHEGEKCHLWKGGITSVHNKIRHSLEYRLWREAGFKRDNYTCQICGQKGKELHFDHFPISFSSILNEVINLYGLENLYENAMSYDKFWDINNSRTLCKNCHKKTDNYLRWMIKSENQKWLNL